MKYGFRTVGFSKWNIFDALDKIKELGYDGVELCLEHPDMVPEKIDDAMIEKVKSYLKKIGLNLASVSYHGDADPVDIKVSNTYKSIEIAKKLGSDILIVNSEKKDKNIPNQFENLVERFKGFSKCAAKNGVKLAFEPEPLLIIETADDMMKLIKEVNSDALNVNIDVGHTYITDPDLSQAILKFDGKIVHCHIEDIKNKVHSHLYPLDGDIDYDGMFKSFDKIGYKGYYVIDMFYIQDEPDVHAKECIKRLKKLKG